MNVLNADERAIVELMREFVARGVCLVVRELEHANCWCTRRRYDSGERAEIEAGMAKLFRSETAMQIALDAIRVHGGHGHFTEFDVHPYFRARR